MSSSTHVCLISKQPIPNLVPLFLEKPEKAIFLVSEETKKEAERLDKVVSERGVKVERLSIDPFHFSGVTEICNKLLERHSGNLVLNVTGGTKVAALAAFQSFYFAESSPRIIYLDTAKDRLLQLSPAESELDVPGLVGVKEYLACYGLNIIKKDSQRNRSGKKSGLRKLCKLLVNNEVLQGQFNSAITEFGKKHYATIPLSKLGDQAENLAIILMECGVASRSGTAQLNIPSAEKLFFCQGGWLEEYVFETIADLGIKGIRPLSNVEISWDGSGKKPTTNELDVLFCHRNRLHVVSCKTSNLDRKTQDSTKGKEALYELDSLSDAVGGIFGKAMLCSTRVLESYTRNRAKVQNIKIVDGKQLLSLETHLRQWICKPFPSTSSSSVRALTHRGAIASRP